MLPLAALAASLFGVEEPVDYARDVRPILTEYCFACHGPDEATRAADLRLDDAEAARASGVLDADESELVYRITEAEDFEVMPPPKMGKALDAKQVEILQRWVAEGAPYADHWAFEAPVRPEPPPVQDEAWVRGPIDRFVLARLEAEGLTPETDADRRALARRLSFDLTGLPPDPDEVDAFVADEAPDAYERLVDRWMDRPEWAEHRARYWLDLARYADTHGIHFDNYRDIWPYRDWVIAAFANDVPFDRFSIEQLAGDLLPEPTIEQRVATGFLRCNITTNEGGLIDEEYKVLYARDRTETFGQIWLGMSVGCAVCHDHKYDPVTQADFYALSAFFDNTTVPVRDGNVQDPQPILRVTPESERDRMAALQRQRDAARAARDERAASSTADLRAWLEAAAESGVDRQIDASDEELSLALREGEGRAVRASVRGAERTVEIEESAAWVTDGPIGSALHTDGATLALDDVGDFEFDQPFTSSAWVKVRKDEPTGALWSRMDAPNGYRGWDAWLQGRRVGAHVIHEFPANWLKVVAKEQLPPDTWVHVAISYDGSRRPDGLAVYYDGVAQPTTIEANSLDGTTRTEVPFRVGTRTGGGATGAALFDLRIHRRVLTPEEIAALGFATAVGDALVRGLDDLPDAARDGLQPWWLRSEDDEWKELDADMRAYGEAIDEIERVSPTAHVFGERDGDPMAYVLYRGEYDQRRDAVGADTPAFLPALDAGESPSRADLARWLFRPDHPLTARVAVNRFWQEVFGSGLVETSGDVGLAGEHPSNPELLDWLAVEFRESGWSVKRLFRTILTSSTYRQSARVTPPKIERDPDNRLLSRGPRFRMDAEMVRDTALAASGLLVREVGGPSVKPYQPPGVWEAVAMRESNTHDYVRDDGAKLWRRSMYTLWKRSAPPASMEIFDAPNRETCAVRRERTNTPLQALVTLNDPQFVEAARVLAATALSEAEWAGERMDWIMRRLTARPLEDGERAICAAVLSDLIEHYATRPDEAAALLAVGETPISEDVRPHVLAAWTMLANTLMNLDEVVTK
ncbi:MAG: DUF1553 domain-containing protein [Planctomycetota bacterium]